MISVIIPTYQHGGTIAQCLASVFGQSISDLEVIVVDDGSTDNTVDALKSFMDRITYIHQENRGGNVARNVGFGASKGEYVIFCDADAIMEPLMLEKMLGALMAHPDAGYAYSGFKFGWKSFSSYPFDAHRLRRMNYIHTTSLIRRQDFPGFDESIKRFQDWDVWLSMLAKGKGGVFIDEELFKIIDDHGRKGISQWRPSIAYRIPWNLLGWKPTSISKYDEAKGRIKAKHDL